MKKLQTFASMMVIAITGTTGFTSCSSSDDAVNENLVYDENGKAGVNSEFVISVPRTVVGTRMSDDVTQKDGTVAEFRGIDNIRLIPFSAKPTQASTKLADILSLGQIAKNGLGNAGFSNYKVYTDKFVPVGTKYFLFYGKAIDNAAEQSISSMDDKFKFGILKAKGISNNDFSTPNGIMFSPVQINTSVSDQAGNTKGQAIVQLMTALANINVPSATYPENKWSTTTSPILRTLYQNFISLSTSSSKTLSVVLGKLWTSMDAVKSNDPGRKIADAIKAKIKQACPSEYTPDLNNPVVLSSTYSGYPGNIGLPDGAARVRWSQTQNKFVDISANYTKSFKLKITDYVYPAALWYHVSTPLMAAPEKKSDKYDNYGSWTNLLDTLYNGADEEVAAGTRSIALKDPIQYAVGRIDTKIKMNAGTYYDGNGNEVNISSGFTLTGILFGGQNSVGFDFTSKGDENFAIYDRVITNNIIAKENVTTSSNQTLGLETKSNVAIHAALELVNNGNDFMGFDGIIPHGGTFYLAVKLDPATASNYNEDDLNKIIIQDHATKLTVTIKNGSTTVDRDGNGIPDKYVKDANGVPTGVDIDGDGNVDDYDIDGDGNNDTFITDPDHGGPGWDIDGDGEVDIHVIIDPETGKYPDAPMNPEGLGGATNGIPDLTSPGIELGTSVDLEWQEGLELSPEI